MLLSPDTLWRNHEWQEVRHGSGVSLLTWSHVRKLTAARRCKNRTVWSDNKLILWPLFQHNPCDLVSALLKKSVIAVTISRLAMHSLQLLLYLRCVKSMVTSLPLHIEKFIAWLYCRMLSNDININKLRDLVGITPYYLDLAGCFSIHPVTTFCYGVVPESEPIIIDLKV